MALFNGNMECRSTATAGNVNGGVFNYFNTSMATDLTTDANTANTNSPVVSSASYNFIARDVNAWLYIKAGTSWLPGWYKIASVASNKATLSAAIGASVNLVNNIFVASTVAGCASVGTPTSGTWSVDYTQQDAAISGTDGSTSGTTNFTSASNPMGKNFVGNVMKITSGGTVTWYEIKSVTGTAATLDQNSSATGSAHYNIGGAMSLGSSDGALWNNVLNNPGATGTTPYSIRMCVKGGGTYALATPSSFSSAAGITVDNPQIWEGYNSLRGDNPNDSTRPVFNCGATTLDFAGSFASFFTISNIIFTGTATNTVKAWTSFRFVNCKFVNTGTTASQVACLASSNNIFIGCEFISYNGTGLSTATNTTQAYGCYFRNCKIGFASSATGTTIAFSIFENCITEAINFSSAASGFVEICNCTIYGAENKLGIGINLVTGSTNVRVLNTIFYGLVTGVTHADVNTIGYDDYNCYYNNTNDVSATANWQKGSHDIAVNPSFTSVTQVTGTAGAFVAGNSKLVDTSQNFTTAGVVAGRDYVYISAGTGITNANMWVGITSISTTTNPNDTLNLDIAQGTNTTTDKTYQITTGHNFLPTGSI